MRTHLWNCSRQAAAFRTIGTYWQLASLIPPVAASSWSHREDMPLKTIHEYAINSCPGSISAANIERSMIVFGFVR